jgi:hypothetical protein
MSDGLDKAALGRIVYAVAAGADPDADHGIQVAARQAVINTVYALSQLPDGEVELSDEEARQVFEELPVDDPGEVREVVRDEPGAADQG